MRDTLLHSNELHSNPSLLDQVLAPAVHILGNYVRGVYRDGPLDDFRFLRLGICRVLSQAASGRDFLQMAREVLGEEVARASFFDSLHCRRRSKVLADLNTELVIRTRSGLEDLLAQFPELQGIPVYAVDGHHIDHAVHSPNDHKGEKVSANNLYLLCLHSGLLWNLGAVQGDGRHSHEMPVFLNQIVPWLLSGKMVKGKGKRAPIFVGDPAFVDKVFWTRMVLEGNRARFITRTKSNMKPMIYASYGWDPKKLVNEGVVADLSVGFDGATTMRIIRYRDPESRIDYEFLTSVMDLEPGLIALLYLTRWRIEKLFDTTKNKLGETKSWAVGPVAQETRAHLVALTHNLLILLRRELEREHEIREEKVEQKRQEQLVQRQTHARTLGRSVAAIQKFLPVAIQLTAQFIRTLRNGILLGMRWAEALALLRKSTKAYL